MCHGLHGEQRKIRAVIERSLENPKKKVGIGVILETPIWIDYVVVGEDGFMTGIKEDAPENVKKAYDKYLKEREELREEGIML